MANIKGTVDLTEGSPRKLIIKFAFPIFLSQLFQQLYNSVDSIIVGNYLGKEALAAVSSSGNLIFLLVSFFTGTAMGAGVVISRYFGAKDYKNVSKAIHTNVALGLIAGVILTLFGLIATPFILKLMGTDKTVLPDAITYFRCYFLGGISIVMYNIFTGVLNAVGDSKRPLYYLICSSILNVLLDLLFIGKLEMGVGAAAVATTIAQTISALLCLKHLLKKDRVYQLIIKEIGIKKDMLGEIIRYGLPTGIQNSVIGFANVIVQTNINSFGANAMAGYGSYSKIEGFAFLPITCFAMSLSTYVSQNLGAGKYDRVKKGARFGILTSIILAEIIGIFIFCMCPYLVKLFNQDTAVVNFGVRQARTEALFYMLLAFSHCIAGICRGAGKAIVPMIIMLSVWCLFRIAYITTIMNFRHEIGFIYWAYPITWSISSVIYFIYNFKSNWLYAFQQKNKTV